MKAPFRLQRILELKERREQTSALRLAEARDGASAARTIETELEALRRGAAIGSVPVARVTVGQMQNAGFLLGRIDDHLTAARAAVRKADDVVDERLADFAEATRERQVLGRLRDRKVDEALQAVAAEDRRKMDEIALTRFIRAAAPESGGDA